MEIQGYHLPDDLYYEENHFWLREDGDLLVMGMDDFGQKMAEQIVFIQLPFEGKKIKTGKKFAQMESGKWVGKIFAPLSGEIAGVNQELETNPMLINEDCYGRGWMFKIRPDDISEINNLIHGAEAVERWVLADIEKYRKD